MAKAPGLPLHGGGSPSTGSQQTDVTTIQNVGGQLLRAAQGTGSPGDGQRGTSAGRGEKCSEKQPGMGSPREHGWRGQELQYGPAPAKTLFNKNPQRWEKESVARRVVGAHELLRQEVLAEAGQCPYPASSFLSRFPWTMRVTGTDTPAPDGDFPQHYSSNPKMSPQRLPAVQVSHSWG